MRRTNMKKIFTFLSCLFLVGCADLKKPSLEVELPTQNLDQLTSLENGSKVILFNRSNKVLHTLGGTGKINISLNGKSIGQLNIGEYLVLDLVKGLHLFELVHKDVVLFKSKHEVVIAEESQFIKIYAKLNSNGLELVEEPVSFREKYRNVFKNDT